MKRSAEKFVSVVVRILFQVIIISMFTSCARRPSVNEKEQPAAEAIEMPVAPSSATEHVKRWATLTILMTPESRLWWHNPL